MPVIPKIDLGFTADKKIKELIAKSTVSEKRVLQFQMECKEFLVKAVCKLIAKEPIQWNGILPRKSVAAFTFLNCIKHFTCTSCINVIS